MLNWTGLYDNEKQLREDWEPDDFEHGQVVRRVLVLPPDKEGV